MNSRSPVVVLADAQLQAYNAADLEAFCACYAEDVVVLDEAGLTTLSGASAFLASYERLFANNRSVRAEILSRISLGRHCIDHERWSRTESATGTTSSGEVLARYTERAGRIALVEFLRP